MKCVAIDSARLSSPDNAFRLTAGGSPAADGRYRPPLPLLSRADPINDVNLDLSSTSVTPPLPTFPSGAAAC
jgi:hypothetical protein